MNSGLNIRQSAQIDRKANNSSTNGGNANANGGSGANGAGMTKNTNSQQFSNVQFNQGMSANGSKSRPGQAAGAMGQEMQSSHGHSKSMSNAHTNQYNQQNLGKLDSNGMKLKPVGAPGGETQQA
jgi:hypothetical protein